MSTKTTDIIALITLFERLIGKALTASALVKKLHREKRTKLTPEEAKSLQDADDAARQDQLDALEEARAGESDPEVPSGAGQPFGHLV